MTEGDRTPEEQTSARPPSPQAGGPSGTPGGALPEPTEREEPPPLPLPEPEAGPRPPGPPPMIDSKLVAEMPPLRTDDPAPAPALTDAPPHIDPPETDPDKPAPSVPTEAGDSPAPTDTPAATAATRVLRHANPIRVAKTAGRTTHAWAKRPAGRLMVPAIIGLLLVGAAGIAGAYLVPAALRSAAPPSATPGFPLDAAAPAPSAPSGRPGGPSAPGLPSGGITPAGPAINGARPADALNGWAQGVGTRVGIPVVAVQAYGYAELVAARTTPNCHLSWTTLAAIAKVESAHGSANGAVLGVDGSVQPPVHGLPLDGRGGRQEIRDTDQGAIDGDARYDRAVGPLQLIPQTWQENAVDADNSGTSDPNDIDDASLAAALYLCKGGRDMARGDAWWDAILSYNTLRPYAQQVFDAANEYGRRSRV